MEGLNNSLGRRRRKPDQITMKELAQQFAMTVNAGLMDQIGPFWNSLIDHRHKVDEECDYPPTESLQPDYYRSLYDRDPFARRAVQLMPFECWQRVPEVFESEDKSKPTKFDEDFKDMCNSLNPAQHSWHKKDTASPFWEYVKRGNVLSRVGQFGIILLAIDDGRNLQDPCEGTEIVANEWVGNQKMEVLIPDSPWTKEMRDLLSQPHSAKGVWNLTFNSKDGPSERTFDGIKDLPPDPIILWNQAIATEQGQAMLRDPSRPEEVACRRNKSERWIIRNRKTGEVVRSYYETPRAREPVPTDNLDLTHLRTVEVGPSVDDLARELAENASCEPLLVRDWLLRIPVGSLQEWVSSGVSAGPVTNGEAVRNDGAPPNGAYIQGIRRDGPTTWSIQGTDRQYSAGYGIGMPAPAAGTDPASLRSIGGGLTSYAPSLSGTDQQYFGVQFGPSEKATDKPTKKRQKLLFMRVFDESLVQIVRYEWNIRNPRFGLPVMYRVTLNDPRQPHSGVGLPLATVYVHWSRVVHLADNLHASEIFGVPTMLPILNPILDCRKMRGASGESIWKSCFAGLSLETNPQMGGDVLVDKKAITGMMREYQERLQRFLVLIGMSAKTLPPQVVDPTPAYTIAENAICTALGCPVRIWRGSEGGGITSGDSAEQDEGAWNDRKREYQENYLTPKVVVPLVDRLIQLGVLSEPKDGYTAKWPDLDALGEEDKANICQKNTMSLTQYEASNSQTIAPWTFLTSEKFLGMTEEEAKDAIEQAEEHQEEQQDKQEEDFEAQQQFADKYGLEPQPPEGYQNPMQDQDQFGQESQDEQDQGGQGGQGQEGEEQGSEKEDQEETASTK